jgi:hypothetical protein
MASLQLCFVPAVRGVVGQLELSLRADDQRIASKRHDTHEAKALET